MKHRIGWHLYFVVALLGLAPFFKGLFPDLNLLVAAFLIFLVGSAFLLQKRAPVERKLNFTDYCVIGLALLYLAATVWGINRRAALQEGITYAAYAVVYWVVSRSLTNDAERSWFVRWLGIIVMGVAVGSVVLGTGVVPYEDAIVGKRLAGPFQYANTLAAVMLLGLPLFSSLRATAVLLRDRLLWGFGIYSTITVLLLTYSRIAWIAAPVMLLVYVVAAGRSRGHVITQAVPGIVGVAAVLAPTIAALRSPTPGLMLAVWFAAGLALVGGLELLWSRIRWQGALDRYAPLVLGAGLIGVVALVFVTDSSFAVRLASISTEDDSLLVRVFTYRDAITAWWHEGALLGTGGGAWATLFTQYRSAAFVTKVAHSSVVETLVEVGPVGVILLLGAWGSTFVAAWSSARAQSRSDEHMLYVGLAAGLLGLLGHSLVDVDLWYPAVSLMVLATMGWFRSCQALPAVKKTEPVSWKYRTIALGLSGGALLLLPLIGAASLYQQVGDSMARGDRNQAIAQLSQAVRYDSLNGMLFATLGDLQLDEALQKQSGEIARAAGINIQKAVNLEPHNPDYLLRFANFHMVTQQSELALQNFEQALVLDPMNREVYFRATREALTNVSKSLGSDSVVEARRYLLRAKAVLDEFDTRVSMHPSDLQKALLLTTDGRIEVLRGIYFAYMGDMDKALALAQPLTRSGNQAAKREAHVLVIAVESFKGRQAEAAKARSALEKLDKEALVRADLLRRELDILNGR